MPPLARSLLSGLKDMLRTELSCPCKVIKHFPYSTSQTLIVLSLLALAIIGTGYDARRLVAPELWF